MVGIFLYPYSLLDDICMKKKRNPELLSDLFGIIVVCIGDYVAMMRGGLELLFSNGELYLTISVKCCIQN